VRRTAAVAAAGAADRIVAVVEAVHTVAAEEAARTAVAEGVDHTAVVEAAGRTAAVEEADRIVAAEALHQHRDNREEVLKEEQIDRFEDEIEDWQREAGHREARICTKPTSVRQTTKVVKEARDQTHPPGAPPAPP
jgi:hypothetical protein